MMESIYELLVSMRLVPARDADPLSIFPIRATTYLPFALFYTQSYYALKNGRVPDRMALLFAITAVTLRIATSLRFLEPSLNLYNNLFGVIGCAIVMKSIEWTFTTPKRRTPPLDRPMDLFDWLGDAFDLICDPRGIHYTFGYQIPVPKHLEKRSRAFYVMARTKQLLRDFLLLDFLMTAVPFIGTLGTTEGGSIFFKELSPVFRYVVSTGVAFCMGLAIYAVMSFGHGLVSLVAVFLFRRSHTSWPPLFDEPWKAESIVDFWGYRWHQLFRRSFHVCGAIPGWFFGGKPGGIIGGFIVSGIMHDIGIRCMGRGGDFARIVGFFLIQAVGIIAEITWSFMVRRKVGGVGGGVWTWIVVVGGANLIAEAYVSRGAGGTVFVPDALSPTKWILWAFGLPLKRYF